MRPAGTQMPLFSSVPAPWFRIDKGDVRARKLADRHYSRQTPGHPLWTRPGYNYVLKAEFERGEALFCWWRPKWEAGVERKDRLRVIECTFFRRVGETPLASELIAFAVDALDAPDAAADLRLAAAGKIERLVTGVSSKKTARGRSKLSLPGKCYRAAGWLDMPDRGPSGRADVWLQIDWRNTFAVKEAA